MPFCFHKCHYCDFYSIVDQQDRMGAFADCLIADLRASSAWAAHRGNPVPLDTIFVGGGTPTLLPVGLWDRVLGAMRDAFDLTGMTTGTGGSGEFTVECNPETASAELMTTLAHGGVNRLSIGAQSFNEGHLKMLERWHDPANVGRAIRLARDAGIARTSVDLIYAIPGQTVAEAIADVDRAVDLGVEHVSAYSLTYEPGTAMTTRMTRGEFPPTDEDTDAEMFEAVADRLAGHGFRRYETSNFARPGAECRHNLAYWRQRAWIAVGPSASAHIAGHRWKNVPRLGTYLSSIGGGSVCPVLDFESPNPRRALAERMMTGLRLSDGLDAGSVFASARSIDARLVADLARAVSEFRREGLIRERGPRRLERWVLTRAGEMLADRIASELMAIVDP